MEARTPGTNLIGINSIAELPKKWKLHAPFYKEGTEFFLPEVLRKSVIAISGRNLDTDPECLIVIYDETSDISTQVKSYIRRLVQSKREKTNGPSPSIAKTQGDSLIKNIYSDSNSRSAIGSQKHNKNTSAKLDFADTILAAAMQMGASDIHVESEGNDAVVRFRVHKELVDYDRITCVQAESFATVCYGTFTSLDGQEGSGKGSYKTSSLLEGEFTRHINDSFSIKGRMINLGHNRGSGFDFITRLIDLNKNAAAKPFDVLGFSMNSCRGLRSLDTASSGAILTAGVTGSGKSTSQQNMLQQERDRSGGTRKLISLEDPVEYAMDRVTQINVGEKSEIAHADTDFTFENLNQKMLRSDPDTIAYGEIRDNVSAKALYKGVESGHLVYGTIHTSTALDVFSRLRSFGLSLDDICKKGFIRLILLQHLLPKLCPHCSIPYHVGDEVPEKYDELFVIKSFMQTSNTRLTVSEVVKISKKNKGRSLLRALQAEERIGAIDVMRLRKKIQQLNEGSESRGFSDRLNSVISNSTLQEEDFNIRFRGHGCDKCLQGQCGVVPASEVIIPDERLLALIKSGDIQKASLYWKSHLGGKTAVQDSYGKIFDGSVDPRSVEEHLVDLLGSS